jgi:prophage antirepressor-like protein
MSALTVFEFREAVVRTQTDERGEIWFVASDVCRALDIGNVSQALVGLQDDERNTLTTTEGIRGRGNPNVNVISESGLYALIFKSRKPEAQDFRRWVTKEVLPSIRRTGSFGKSENGLQEALALLLMAVERLQGKQLRKAVLGIAAATSDGRDLARCWDEEVSPRWLAAENKEFGALVEVLERGTFTSRRLMQRAGEIGIRGDIFRLPSDMAVRSAFGRWLMRYDGRTVRGFHFEARGHGNSRRYVITPTEVVG